MGVKRWHTPGEWSGPLAQRGYDFARDEVQRLEWGGSAPFAGRNSCPPGQTQEAWTADRAIEMVDAFGKGDDPFLVFASFFGPHFSYAVPAPWDTQYDPAAVARPANFDERFAGKPLVQQKELLRWNAAHLTWPDWQRVIAAYWGYCSFVDHQVGRVLEALERSGRADKTIVVVTADHGDMLGSHRLFNKGFHIVRRDPPCAAVDLRSRRRAWRRHRGVRQPDRLGPHPAGDGRGRAAVRRRRARR